MALIAECHPLEQCLKEAEVPSLPLHTVVVYVCFIATSVILLMVYSTCAIVTV